MNLHDVRVGQLWLDNDSRPANRTIRIYKVDAGFGYGIVFIDGAETNRYTRIRLSRFTGAKKSGYRLLEDSAAVGGLQYLSEAHDALAASVVDSGGD